MRQCISVGLIVTLMILTFVPHADAADDLVGHWKFDEESGSTATDASGNGKHGTLTNVTRSTGTLPPVEFANASSVFFNSGSSGRIVSTPLSLNNFTEFTMAGWMYPTAATDRASLFGQNDIFEFGFTDSDTIFCYTSKGEVSWDFTPGTFLNNWHHITCLATDSQLIMYVDGVNRASSAISAGSFGSSGDNFSIGAGAVDGGTQGPFTGYIDDVRVYSRGLTPSEMETLGEGGSGPTNLPSISLTSPADNATDVSLTADLAVTFSVETIATSTGTIGIHQTSDDSLVESFALTSNRISKSGATFTIDPTDPFEESTEYYVWIPDTAFKDASDSFFEGTASTTWSFTTGDFTTPSLSSIVATSTESTAASITWSTNESASTKVAYGLTTSYGTNTSETDTSPRVTSHSKVLSGLLACTTYHYAVVSRDTALNAATSTDATFTTIGCVASSTPITATSTSVTSSSGGSTNVTDSGKTFAVSLPANATATSSSVVIQVQAIGKTPVIEELGTPASVPNAVSSVVFDVKAIIDGNTILDSFDHPVTITYTYTDADVSGLDESTFWLYHYHDDAWEALDDCSVNTGTNTITCTTPNFSIFGLFGSSLSSASNGSSSGGGALPWCSGPSAPGWVSSLSDGGCGTLVLAEPVQQVTQSTCPAYTFARTLRFGMSGEDVRALQKLMNCLGFKLAESGPGAPGEETNMFVGRTHGAVIKFQEKYAPDILAQIGATKGTGIFAEYSRKKAQELLRIK